MQNENKVDTIQCVLNAVVKKEAKKKREQKEADSYMRGRGRLRRWIP